MRALTFSAGWLLVSSLLAAAACSGASETSAGGAGGSGNSGPGQVGASSTAGNGDAGGPVNPSSTGSGSGSGGSSECTDACPAPGGAVDYECKSRFMYGVNYAWSHFAGDFGGISQWGQPGVAASAEEHAKKLADMRAHGAGVIRWWVFPDFRGDGIDFDQSENPTGIAGTLEADVKKALELADQADVYLMLCIFSFDAFRPSEDVSGIWTPGITPMVQSEGKRQKLLENVVRPLAKITEASPHKRRLIAWDVINEPEWAITGPSPYGDPDYDPIKELKPVSHQEMEAFVGETIKVLREESGALVTVGAAAMKWSRAWSNVDIDFYSFHIYDWVNNYWPYSSSPADFGVDDRPVVMGEFPLGGLSNASYAQMLETWYAKGYAGALGWQYGEASQGQLSDVKAFSDGKSCETHY